MPDRLTEADVRQRAAAKWELSWHDARTAVRMCGFGWTPSGELAVQIVVTRIDREPYCEHCRSLPDPKQVQIVDWVCNEELVHVCAGGSARRAHCNTQCAPDDDNWVGPADVGQATCPRCVEQVAAWANWQRDHGDV